MDMQFRNTAKNKNFRTPGYFPNVGLFVISLNNIIKAFYAERNNKSGIIKELLIKAIYS